jgi:hypothetical protein
LDEEPLNESGDERGIAPYGYFCPLPFYSYFFRLFRIDTSKFRSGILNSYRPIPIAPQARACSQKTGEIGSQS